VEEALEVYCTPGVSEDLGEQITDLLADLMRLCDTRGMDFSEMLHVATVHHNEEVELCED
jgi:hypothetical protein